MSHASHVICYSSWSLVSRLVSSPPEYEQTQYDSRFFANAFGLMMHTCAVIYSAFLFCVCSYWFIVFKFQNPVHLLLPSNQVVVCEIR